MSLHHIFTVLSYNARVDYVILNIVSVVVAMFPPVVFYQV